MKCLADSLTGDQLTRVRKALGIDSLALAKQLYVHLITVSRCERGSSRLPKAVAPASR
jgi:hypothetical protein